MFQGTSCVLWLRVCSTVGGAAALKPHRTATHWLWTKYQHVPIIISTFNSTAPSLFTVPNHVSHMEMTLTDYESSNNEKLDLVPFKRWSN